MAHAQPLFHSSTRPAFPSSIFSGSSSAFHLLCSISCAFLLHHHPSSSSVLVGRPPASSLSASHHLFQASLQLSSSALSSSTVAAVVLWFLLCQPCIVFSVKLPAVASLHGPCTRQPLFYLHLFTVPPSQPSHSSHISSHLLPTFHAVVTVPFCFFVHLSLVPSVHPAAHGCNFSQQLSTHVNLCCLRLHQDAVTNCCHLSSWPPAQLALCFAFRLQAPVAASCVAFCLCASLASQPTTPSAFASLFGCAC